MYRQITSGERYTLGALHAQGISQAAIARALGRHPSTVSRELGRNRTRYDGMYRHSRAQEYTNGRRSRSRRNRRFSAAELRVVEVLLKEKFSPEQISGQRPGSAAGRARSARTVRWNPLLGPADSRSKCNVAS